MQISRNLLLIDKNCSNIIYRALNSLQKSTYVFLTGATKKEIIRFKHSITLMNDFVFIFILILFFEICRFLRNIYKQVVEFVSSLDHYANWRFIAC